jgi:CheY-like chemotaxis protein/signal transduction histidine kinase/HAMP domain-containing protein
MIYNSETPGSDRIALYPLPVAGNKLTLELNMKSYNNLSIRSKIMLAVVLIISLELMLAAGSLYFLTTVNSHMSQIVQTDAEKLKLASTIRTGLLEMHRAQKNALLFTSDGPVERQIDRRNYYIGKIHATIAEIDRFTDPRVRSAMQEMNVLLAEFIRIDKQIERMIRARFGSDPADPAIQAAAVALSTGSGRVVYDQLSELIDTVVREAETTMFDNQQRSMNYFNAALLMMVAICAASIVGGLLVGSRTAWGISRNLAQLAVVTDAISQGDLEARLAVSSGDETGSLAASVQRMQTVLRQVAIESAERDYVKTGIARINDAMRGRVNVDDLCTAAIHEMASYLGARVGAIFLMNGGGPEPVLEFRAGYAYDNPDQCATVFRIGQGLVGEAALSKVPIQVHDLPAGYIKVCSGLGEGCPACITLAPLIFQERVNGVVELGFFESPDGVRLEFLEQALPALAVTIETVRGREQLARSLAQEQVLTEELQQQQDELKAVNEELEEQTLRLKQSGDKLLMQQEELETANAELEEKNSYLENSKALIERSNRDLANTRLDIEEKAEQLARASRYKSEFLANMSHELRTPLNSILLLAGMLGDNKEGNLTEKQTRSANIIHSSGNDLLTLINEVLDLARIEAGKMELCVERVELRQVADGIVGQFGHLIEEKGLRLDVRIDPACPAHLSTDPRRLGQILRNLVSNAIKFTEKGHIRLELARPSPQDRLPAGLQREATVAIAVGDTGIGIAPEQHQIVFEAFQQLDHGAARKFPGTGLGLAISRELAQLMGGDIVLASHIGAGSTFTVLLPDEIPGRVETACGGEWAEPLGQAPQRMVRPVRPVLDDAATADDRECLAQTDNAILIIEDDPVFAQLLMDLCRERACKVLIAPSGEQGLELAAAHLPKGIFLDIHLPGRDGWSVLEALKGNPRTRHIPVHILSIETDAKTALERGAVGFLSKPVERQALEQAMGRLEDVFKRPMKELLVVEDDETLRQGIIELVGNGDVHSDEAGSAAEALQAIRSKRYDCVILDLGLPDMKGIDLLKALSADTNGNLPPVIVYTGKELTHEQENELRDYSDAIIIKGVCSQERLLDEASLFLHRVVDNMPERKRKLITNLHDCDVIFRDKKILIVDDDMRNVFALSKLLEEKGVITFKAENGRKALALLESNAEIDLVLMDMMMPVMDGYETIKQIRSRERLRNIPLIALTAKAMAQDRVRCIQAGASDYLSKPVDMMRLFSMMRVWLYR